MGLWLAPPRPTITITPFAAESLAGNAPGSLGAPASSTFPSANAAYFFPFRIWTPITVRKLFAHNGATASGNIDVGIYDAQGRKLVSAGSTAQAGTNALQEFDVTDTVIGPGLFYLAVAMDNTTGTLFRSTFGGSVNSKVMGEAQQASAFPLPATATFATANVNMLLIGLTTRTVL